MDLAIMELELHLHQQMPCFTCGLNLSLVEQVCVDHKEKFSPQCLSASSVLPETRSEVLSLVVAGCSKQRSSGLLPSAVFLPTNKSWFGSFGSV